MLLSRPRRWLAGLHDRRDCPERFWFETRRSSPGGTAQEGGRLGGAPTQRRYVSCARPPASRAGCTSEPCAQRAGRSGRATFATRPLLFGRSLLFGQRPTPASLRHRRRFVGGLVHARLDVIEQLVCVANLFRRQSTHFFDLTLDRRPALRRNTMLLGASPKRRNVWMLANTPARGSPSPPRCGSRRGHRHPKPAQKGSCQRSLRGQPPGCQERGSVATIISDIEVNLLRRRTAALPVEKPLHHGLRPGSRPINGGTGHEALRKRVAVGSSCQDKAATTAPDPIRV